MKNFDLSALKLQSVSSSSVDRSLREHATGITLQNASKLNQAVDPATAIFNNYSHEEVKGREI
jgi:hypothetical protein